ncbi:hypothetical protein AB6A40_004007 [Gnathostoma spinigerum]|uniref:RRM domain-containing protein n=1 Tax=Gnathostoma spinigerum TaxID=75299 RepID=A0ABD6EBD2_9BILA
MYRYHNNMIMRSLQIVERNRMGDAAVTNEPCTKLVKEEQTNGSSTKQVEGQQSEQVDYVVVAESEDGEAIELPIDPKDGSLGMTTLVHTFPGAHGLKYKNPVTGATRALLMDPSGNRFLPPADGWSGKKFLAIFPPRGSGGDPNPKRKKMMDECEEDSDGDEHAGGYGPGGQVTAKQKRVADPIEKTTTDLIVLGIPYKTSSETVKEYFETFGEVVMFDLKKDSEGNSKGFGFVRMKEFDAQLRVLAKQVHDIDGRHCQVKIPLSKGELGPNFVTRIFVGRVPERLTADDLRTFFTGIATKIEPEAIVTDVFIPRPFRSFAFVNFSHPSVASQIIKMGDFVIDGSSVAVSAAAPRESAGYSPYSHRGGFHGGAGSSPAPFHRRGAPNSPLDGYPPGPASSYYDSYGGSSQWDSSRGGAYRSSDSRGSNRFTPGYGSSQRPTRPGTSQALVSTLDALNLNKMSVNPEVMESAWTAFWTTLNQSGNGGAPPPNTQKW